MKENNQRNEKIQALIEIANNLFTTEEKADFIDFLEDHNINVRMCSKCHKLITEGYCIEDGEAYYCSDECLESEMTREEYNELYGDGVGDTYYTTWEN